MSSFSWSYKDFKTCCLRGLKGLMPAVWRTFFNPIPMLSLVMYSTYRHNPPSLSWISNIWYVTGFGSMSLPVEMGELSVIVWLHYVKMSSSQIVYVCLPKTDPEISYVGTKEGNYLEIFPLSIVWMIHVWEDNIKIDLIEVVQGLHWSGAR